MDVGHCVAVERAVVEGSTGTLLFVARSLSGPSPSVQVLLVDADGLQASGEWAMQCVEPVQHLSLSSLPQGADGSIRCELVVLPRPASAIVAITLAGTDRQGWWSLSATEVLWAALPSRLDARCACGLPNSGGGVAIGGGGGLTVWKRRERAVEHPPPRNGEGEVLRADVTARWPGGGNCLLALSRPLGAEPPPVVEGGAAAWKRNDLGTSGDPRALGAGDAWAGVTPWVVAWHGSGTGLRAAPRGVELRLEAPSKAGAMFMGGSVLAKRSLEPLPTARRRWIDARPLPQSAWSHWGVCAVMEGGVAIIDAARAVGGAHRCLDPSAESATPAWLAVSVVTWLASSLPVPPGAIPWARKLRAKTVDADLTDGSMRVVVGAQQRRGGGASPAADDEHCLTVACYRVTALPDAAGSGCGRVVAWVARPDPSAGRGRAAPGAITRALDAGRAALVRPPPLSGGLARAAAASPAVDSAGKHCGLAPPGLQRSLDLFGALDRLDRTSSAQAAPTLAVRPESRRGKQAAAAAPAVTSATTTPWSISQGGGQLPLVAWAGHRRWAAVTPAGVWLGGIGEEWTRVPASALHPGSGSRPPEAPAPSLAHRSSRPPGLRLADAAAMIADAARAIAMGLRATSASMMRKRLLRAADGLAAPSRPAPRSGRMRRRRGTLGLPSAAALLPALPAPPRRARGPEAVRPPLLGPRQPAGHDHPPLTAGPVRVTGSGLRRLEGACRAMRTPASLEAASLLGIPLGQGGALAVPGGRVVIARHASVPMPVQWTAPVQIRLPAAAFYGLTLRGDEAAAAWRRDLTTRLRGSWGAVWAPPGARLRLGRSALGRLVRLDMSGSTAMTKDRRRLAFLVAEAESGGRSVSGDRKGWTGDTAAVAEERACQLPHASPLGEAWKDALAHVVTETTQAAAPAPRAGPATSQQLLAELAASLGQLG